MPPGAAGLQERRRTYEGCRDLHQSRSVLAAVPGGGRAPRERVPPSLGPLQEGLRICFETPEGRQAPGGNRASGAHLYRIANVIVHRNMASLRNGVKNRVAISRSTRPCHEPM